MIEDYTEAFEQTRSAGKIAAGALNEVAKIAKAGTRTIKLIVYVMSILMITVLIRRHYFIEVSLNHVVRQLIMLFAMGYPLIKF